MFVLEEEDFKLVICWGFLDLWLRLVIGVYCYFLGSLVFKRYMDNLIFVCKVKGYCRMCGEG